MSVQSPLSSLLFDHREAPRLHNISPRPPPSNMAPSSFFGSIKKTLSRKGSNPRDSTMANTSSSSSNAKSTSRSSQFAAPLAAPPHSPLTSGAPPTRRPIRPGMNAFSTTPNEAPPAYTPGPANQPASSASSSNGADDPYSFLKTFDTVFLIDDSGSMAGRSWRETAKALETITPICTQRDADGIDIYFLNHPDSSIYKNVTSPGTVVEIFQTVRPGGGTPTGQRLHNILKPYLEQYARKPDTTKPINIIVITDGASSDDVESPIIAAAKKLDKLDAPAWQVGIQFFQVGREPGAREALKQLDDGLAEVAGVDELRDIVDTVPFLGSGDEELSAAGIMKVVLGSVNRRLDRNSRELHRH